MDRGLDAVKTGSKKLVHKAVEVIGNRIADAVTKSNDDNTERQEPVEEIIIPPEERNGILNKLEKYGILYKITKLLRDSTASKFVTKKLTEKNDLSSGQYSVNKNIRLKT